VVLTGAGRGYCAGADLSGGTAFQYEDPTQNRDTGGTVSLRIFESLKPVIVAVNGPAVGIGVTMTLPADIRLASTNARFGFVFARRGVIPEAASSWFLPRVAGISRALEWVATGRVFDAAEALEGGLVRSVHEPEDLLPAAYALAKEIAANTAPVSVAVARQMMWRMLGADHPMAAHQLDSRVFAERGMSGDAREGVTSFLEKRPAAFPDRVSDGMPPVFPWWPDRPWTPFDEKKND
jgi:enoyl-CoA hydratase/carnithine racemase